MAAVSHRNLVLPAAVVSLAVVGYDIHQTNPGTQAAVKTYAAVALLWGLVFLLGEVNDELGSAVAVFTLLVFLVARHGAVEAAFSTFGAKAPASKTGG